MDIRPFEALGKGVNLEEIQSLSKKTRLRLLIYQIIKIILLNINNLIINIGVTFKCF